MITQVRNLQFYVLRRMHGLEHGLEPTRQALFIAAEDDELIRVSHAHSLLENYGTAKSSVVSPCACACATHAKSPVLADHANAPRSRAVTAGF